MLVLLLAILLAAPAEQPAKEESRQYDFGVKKVSDTILGLWMHDSEIPNRLPFIVFLEDEPHWYDGEVKVSRETRESALVLDYTAGKGTLTLEFNPTKDELLLFGTSYDLSAANVFVVRGFTGYADKIQVKGVVAWEIVSPEKMNPAEYVLSRLRKEGLAQ